MSDIKTMDSMTGWNHQRQGRPTLLSRNGPCGYLESHGGALIGRLADSGSDLVALSFPSS